MGKYLLTDKDRTIVKLGVDRVTPKERDEIIAIHEEQLASNHKKLASLQYDIDAVERAIAMREEAIYLLRSLTEPEDQPECVHFWITSETLERIRLAQYEGFTHINLQARTGRSDDYYTVKVTISDI